MKCTKIKRELILTTVTRTNLQWLFKLIRWNWSNLMLLQNISTADLLAECIHKNRIIIFLLLEKLMLVCKVQSEFENFKLYMLFCRFRVLYIKITVRTYWFISLIWEWNNYYFASRRDVRKACGSKYGSSRRRSMEYLFSSKCYRGCDAK